MRRILVGAVTTVVLAVAAAASGAGLGVRTTLFVDRGSPSCSNAESGTRSRPFCSINAAARKVKAGQTVEVATGIYPEGVSVRTSGSARARIVFTAAPGAVVTLHGEAATRRLPWGFHISNKRWITVNGFNVTQTDGYGIDVQNSSHVTISNNHVSYAGRPLSGMARSAISLSSVSDSLVSGNTVDHNSSYGINLIDGSTRNLVRGNVSFANARGYERAASGIRIYTAPRNTVTTNVVFGNEDSGLEFDHANDGIAINNVSFDNNDHGIDSYASSRVQLVGNTVRNNATAGINFEGGSTGATIRNNVSVDNAIGGPRSRGNIRVFSDSTVGTTMDYDQVHLTSPDILLIWNDVNYMSLAEFQTSTGQEAHGVDAEPHWTICRLQRNGPSPIRLTFLVARAATCAAIG